MEAVVILIMALLFFAFVGLGVYVTVKAVGAARRGVDRTIAQARRTVEDTTLKAKSYGQPGMGSELARLRLSLRTSMRATQEALTTGVTSDASLTESVALFERLSEYGHQLDDELRRLERDPDKERAADRIPELRERTEQVVSSADSLRWAVRDRAQKFADDDLASLSEQIRMESGALRHWAAVEPEPEQRDTARQPGATATPSQTWPRTAGTGPGAPEENSGSAAASAPQAITGRDPNRQPTYPWQKAPRPESTT
ncbi:hypothetical protein OG897_07340 [Streptomyces sp. NBC_00237]|uniref:hypothetical protein n=1 Tax=Streptomyces sp. NBC_00237 TaxID=2975687 RepID=UPI0022592FE1|nr:hypothetical protein [Streptomyces sp. NBC_00237]MCX5201268.1 hypothetical protein [Streptomyces sp. NBC_00237]